MSTPDRLRLDIDSITPRVVRAGTQALTVVGSITNIGDRRITDLIARLELGDRLSTNAEARAALSGPLPSYRSKSWFEPVADALRPGETTRLRLRVPLDGSPGALTIRRPGVYPLLINVNGTPDYGGQARLVAFNLLLPVLDAGGASSRGTAESPETDDAQNTGSSTEKPDTSDPLGVSLLWPITTRRPYVVRDTYGSPLVLANDKLAASLAPGGRLHSLVATASAAVRKGRISSAVCFALDPALLQTVQAMTSGYRVRTSTGLVQGTGVEAAKEWLAALRALVAGHCVIQIPYADADLSALARIGSTAEGDERLMPLAVNGADVIRGLLDVQALQGVLWPAGELSAAALTSAARVGVSTVVTGVSRPHRPPDGAPGSSAVRLAGTGIRAQRYDPLMHRALSRGSEMTDVAVQNALGTLFFRIRQHTDAAGRGSDSGAHGSSEATLLIAPPHRWNAPADELATFLETLGRLAEAGRIEPVSFQEVLEEEVIGGIPPDSGITRAGGRLSDEVVRTLSEAEATATDLASAMAVDPTSLVQPEAVVRPVRQAVLRASSTAWRKNPAQRAAAVRAARQQVEAITSQVTISPPPQPIALASEDSPLPVYISNELPVTITVRIKLISSAGLRPKAIPYQTIPANSARNRRINIEPLRAGHITIGVKLSTPGGTQLGTVQRFELLSTEYGVVTIVITSTAAGALLLLSGRRIYRRVRTRGSRPDGSGHGPGDTAHTA